MSLFFLYSSFAWHLFLDSCFSIHMHWINSPVFLYVTVMPILLIQEEAQKVRITIIYLVSERYISDTY